MEIMYKKLFGIHNVNLENFNGSFIDELMKIDFKYADKYDSFWEPYALFLHLSESSRFQHKLIKIQMAQVDPLNEPELYKIYRSLAEHSLKLWLLSTESIKNYELSLDREA
jgi:hypothetical protein